MSEDRAEERNQPNVGEGNEAGERGERERVESGANDAAGTSGSADVPTRRRAGRLLVVAVVLQLLVLLGMAGSNAAVDWMGTTIQLRTAPIDPRDLFYGDYVTLNYEISQLPPELWVGEESPQDGQRVYVKLAPERVTDTATDTATEQAGTYEAVAVSSDRMSTSGEEVLLLGRIVYSWSEQIRIEYGLERYYIPEGTGLELEEQREGMQVEVTIAPWGQKKLNRLLPGT